MPVFSAPSPHVAALAAALTAVLAGWGMYRVRGSTAVPAAAWSLIACLALAAEMAAHAAGRLADPAAAAAARLAVVSLSLCPAMSLLGAKRPQHGAWQFIVATLAFVLFLPAISARLVRPGSLPDLHIIERAFMPLLILVGWLNFAATRRAAAVTCVAFGQLVLLRGFLPGVATAATAFGGRLDALAAASIACGGLIATAQALATIRPAAAANREYSTPAPPDGPASADDLAAAVDPAFLGIRETLGAAWALRLAEAFDSLATARGWPCRLRFGGLAVEGSEDAAWHRDARHAFRALARRFVDDGWLARHGWPADGREPQASRNAQA
jgi:hypothetical protein